MSLCFKSICDSIITIYSFLTVPSKVWSRGDDKCHLYVGGFKSSLNITFLKEHSIGLIVNAAYLLDRLYPPSTKIYQEFEKRRSSKELEHIEELFVNWLDDPKQIIKSSILKDILKIKFSLKATKNLELHMFHLVLLLL